MEFKDLELGEYYAYDNLCNVGGEAGKNIKVVNIDFQNKVFDYIINEKGTYYCYFVKTLEENLPFISSKFAKYGTEKVNDKKDMVNHPQHYNKGKYEVIDVIEDWGLGFNLGNAIKYIARCEHKGNKKQDLEKALFYLERFSNGNEGIHNGQCYIEINDVLEDWRLSPMLTKALDRIYSLEFNEAIECIKKELEKEE